MTGLAFLSLATLLAVGLLHRGLWNIFVKDGLEADWPTILMLALMFGAGLTAIFYGGAP